MDVHSFFEIDERRERLGVSQAQLCRAADVSESTLTRVRQENREPSERIRRRLQNALQQIQDQRGVAIAEEARG